MFNLFKRKKKLNAEKFIIDIILSAINSNQNGLRDALKAVTDDH
jgi:hypothetical protein